MRNCQRQPALQRMVELSRCAAGRRCAPKNRLDPSGNFRNTPITTGKSGASTEDCVTRGSERLFHKSLLPKGCQKSNLHIKYRGTFRSSTGLVQPIVALRLRGPPVSSCCARPWPLRSKLPLGLANQPLRKRSNDVRNRLGIARLSFFGGWRRAGRHRTPACQWC